MKLILATTYLRWKTDVTCNQTEHLTCWWAPHTKRLLTVNLSPYHPVRYTDYKQYEHEAWERRQVNHMKKLLCGIVLSLWEWCLIFVFNQSFYACNENGPAGRHKVLWTELNCSSLRSLATRHRQAVNKKAICQSVSTCSSNQWRLTSLETQL